MMTTLNILVLLLNAVFIGTGVYLSSYLKRKADNLATREDFEELRRQTASLTQTTKEIEAKISGELWDRQKQWELKREIFFQVTSRISAVFEALKNLENILQTELKTPSVKNGTWTEISIAENSKWFQVMAALQESQLFVSVTYGKDIVEALDKYVLLTTRIAAPIHKKDAAIFKSSTSQLFALRDAMRDAFRKELGIPPRASPQ